VATATSIRRASSATAPTLRAAWATRAGRPDTRPAGAAASTPRRRSPPTCTRAATRRRFRSTPRASRCA
jgi:hypothetical protein